MPAKIPPPRTVAPYGRDVAQLQPVVLRQLEVLYRLGVKKAELMGLVRQAVDEVDSK
jgi:hypothetical protein